MSLAIWALASALAAIGIFLVMCFLTVAKLIEKLKNSHTDFFKATIKRNYTTMGVDVVDVEVKDLFGNTIANDSYAGLNGISSSLYTGRTFDKYTT